MKIRHFDDWCFVPEKKKPLVHTGGFLNIQYYERSLQQHKRIKHFHSHRPVLIKHANFGS